MRVKQSASSVAWDWLAESEFVAQPKQVDPDQRHLDPAWTGRAALHPIAWELRSSTKKNDQHCEEKQMEGHR